MRSWSTRRWRKGSPRFSARCPPGPDAVCRYLLTPDPNPRDPMIQTTKVAHRTVKARDLDIFYHEPGPKKSRLFLPDQVNLQLIAVRFPVDLGPAQFRGEDGPAVENARRKAPRWKLPGGSGRLRAGSLRPGGRGGVDRPHEVNGVRGRGDQSVRRPQPAAELGLRAHERPGFLGRAGRRRGRHRAAHRRPPVLASGFRPRERPGGGDVPHDPELPHHDARRLGAKSRWLPRPLRAPGAVPHQGSGPTRDFPLDARRGLEGERAKGASPLSVRVRVRPKAVVRESEYGGRPVSAPYLV